ncbi:threonine ammonia-lyase [Varunaivibrio sulfuroxidans]|uniref:Threonine dehydratase n=1 Tax=Varunaivibrio sulfuroxidans TaxID=1773489 RepID=A0A4V6NYK1_9PROT|nr:threonine/serine dehydratase [Varunaivibrio sulfuroxidans]TCS64211.1 threonine dehydratase [Varunaivibrio sulfuroxidans]WES31346.1 threonine/serine dehydratase [Varunaivibrio sulfuroxidans]
MDAPKEPTFDDLRQAQARLHKQAVRTPLLESPLLNQRLGGRLLIKPEMTQKSGAFKFRGAYNAITALIERDPDLSGVITYSSGNHAQGVALSAALHGVAAVIIMPDDAPAAKIAKTRAYGAEVVHYRRGRESREEIGENLARERALTLVRPYDEPLVIAGQGTIGIEIAEDVQRLGLTLDAVIAPCGGGGMSAGIAIALETLLPDTALYTAEPEDFDDMARSLVAGARQSNASEGGSICDALMTPSPGELTFAINRHRVKAGLVASDADALDAMALLFDHFKVVSEPGGAISVATILNGAIDITGRTIVTVCSGGNVDHEIFIRALSR